MYKNLANNYRKTVHRKKNVHINKEIVKCGRDPKQLYKVINKLLGRTKKNPLPDYTDEGALTEEFSNYFYTKINMIRTELNTCV